MTRSARGGVMIAWSAVALVASIASLFAVPDGYSEQTVGVIVVLAIALILIQGISNAWLRKTTGWFQIDMLFVLSFFFVHFWMWASFSLDLVDARSLSPKYLDNANYCAALSFFALCAFLFGYNVIPRISRGQRAAIVDRERWLNVGYILFFAGAAGALAYAAVFGAAAFQGSYSGSVVGGLPLRTLYVLQGILVKLGIAIVLISKADRRHLVPRCPVVLLVFSGVLLMYLVQGDRSEFVYTLAVAVFAYSSFYRRISLPVLLAGIAALALLMSAVQIARNAQNRSVGAIVEAASESRDVSVMAGLANISSSGGVLLAAVTAVPEDHDYFVGELKALELLGIIPFGRALFFDKTVPPQYFNSSSYLTWYVLGPNATSGVGTTIVADPYVDYGAAGVGVALFVLGFLANLLRDRSESSTSMTYAVLYCYFAALLVMLPRYSFLMIVRGLIWPIIFFWLIRKLLVGRQPRRVRMAGVVHGRR